MTHIPCQPVFVKKDYIGDSDFFYLNRIDDLDLSAYAFCNNPYLFMMMVEFFFDIV